MFGITTEIKITQQSTAEHAGRSKVFNFNFVTTGNGNLTWSHLTDTFNVVLPRRIYFKEESTGKVITWNDTKIYGNPETQPLLMRGDAITVDLGYTYFKPTQGGGFNRRETVVKSYRRFSGFITKIVNKTPIELECKDNMYILQQTQASKKDNTEWLVDGKSYTLETMLKTMMKNITDTRGNFSIKTDNYKHNIGKYCSFNFTIAQVLDELRRTYHLESFFVGKELRVGVIRYYPEDRQTHVFNFQRNVSEDNLDYQRADDIRIGILAKSINKVEQVSTNSANKKRTKHVQLKVNVGDTDGEIRTLFFWGIETTAELKKVAEKKLPFLKYEGFRGSFTTFGLPLVKHGDAVQLEDEVLPERNGTYLVKQVEPTISVNNGLKQRISLDIRIDGLSQKDLADFQQNGI